MAALLPNQGQALANSALDNPLAGCPQSHSRYYELNFKFGLRVNALKQMEGRGQLSLFIERF